MRRKKGSGQLILRGNAWQLRIDGRQISLGTADRLQAELKAAQTLESMRQGKSLLAARDAISIPLKEVWGMFASRAGCGRLTLNGYSAKWKTFMRFIRAKFPDVKSTQEVTPEHGEAFRAWLLNRTKRSIGAYTANRSLKWTSYILRKAAYVEPFKSIATLQNLDTPKREGFTAPELEALHAVFVNDAIVCMHKNEMETVHYIGLHTGLRLGDCCLLKWSAVDLEKKMLTVEPSKTKRYNRMLTIPIVPELATALQRAESKKAASGYVCPNVAKRYLYNRCGISQDYTWLLHKAGIQTEIERKGRAAQVIRSFHSLRHTFVSRLAEKGISPLVIQSMSGHTTMKMLEKYSHIGLDAKRMALEGHAGPAVTEETQIRPAQPVAADGEAERKLAALKVLLKGKVPDEILSLL